MKFSFSFQLTERLLERQVGEYLLWKEARTTSCADRGYLTSFMKSCVKNSIEDIVLDDIGAFKDAMQETTTEHFVANAIKSVRCLFRYHKARKIECLNPALIYSEKMLREQGGYATLYGMEKTKAKMGRPLNVKRILTVKRLRDEGINGVPLSFRRIANLMRRNVSLIHHWYYFPLDERLKSKK